MVEMKLPAGWASSTVGELADYVNGRAFKPSEWKDAGKPIIRIQNLNDESANYNFSIIEHEKKYHVNNGDLLFAWSASLGAHIWYGGDAWLNQHIFNVHPKSCTTKLFVYYLLKKITAELYSKAHGSGMVHVTKGKFESTEIGLPPLNEQHRIVAKIEELFSEVDKGIANLKTAQEQLRVYRQALLRCAFEGKLTAQWRAEKQDKLESADALLARIQTEREQRYQQQLQQWQASGKQGSKPKAPKALTPITNEELAELPELPEEWDWCKFDEVASVDSNLVDPSDYADYPHIAPDNIEKEIGYLLTYRTIAEDEVTSPKHRFYAGQIIYSKIRPYLSKLVIAQFDGLCSADMYPLSTGLNTKFLFYLMLSKYFVSKASNSGSRTILPKINQNELGIIPLPVCSLAEQAQIIGRLESILSEADQFAQTLTASLQQAEALRQSILKKAFSGQLVAQDPDDEPAAELLARIQAEKSAEQTGLGRQRRKAKVVA